MKENIQVAHDGESITYVSVDEGLLAGAFTVKEQLFVRAQKDPAKTNIDWDAAWQKVKECFGVHNHKQETPIHTFDDGTEIRQIFL